MGEPTMMVRTPSGQIEPGNGADTADRETGREIERLPPGAVAAALGVDAVSGLSRDEARARAGLWGPNALRVRPPVPTWRRLLAQFADPLVLLLVAAAAISSGSWLREAVADGRAGRPSKPSPSWPSWFSTPQWASSRRRGRAGRRSPAADIGGAGAGRPRRIRREIPARELVPGDVIRIEGGDAIPADARLIEASALQAGEATLTGESVSVPKDAASLPGEASLGGRAIWCQRHRHRHRAERRHRDGDRDADRARAASPGCWRKRRRRPRRSRPRSPGSAGASASRSWSSPPRWRRPSSSSRRSAPSRPSSTP